MSYEEYLVRAADTVQSGTQTASFLRITFDTRFERYIECFERHCLTLHMIDEVILSLL